ncbi:MAG: pyruvate kinase [Planctomycetes bacterium]|nr:pyruvate kinase [Planctomycetota bacterium]MCC8115876.1 pyruvate kinase [Planctomycetota bacterium]MCD7897033.1 pyruvate kinase [Planctomycetaceae bacterium]
MRATKIVATLGPASSTPETIRQLIREGVNVFRLNFSHGTHESHRETIGRVRQASRELGIDVAILQDLCGPKVRVGLMQSGAVELRKDATITITTREVLGTEELFQTQYDALPRDVRPGDRILLDDGQLELEVLSAAGEDICARVVRGGILKNNKGMNLPGVTVSAPSVTEKDLHDLTVGIEENLDFIALSFIRRPEDMNPVREALHAAGCDARIIAKIEKPEAVENIEAIVRHSDGIMVARGDLGIETPLEKVPMLQKRLIRLANAMDRYVITATQMLESMTTNAILTRAEVSDVANAIVDGTDAVMLSGETAAGVNPVAVVRMMSAIAVETERYLRTHPAPWNWSASLSSENPMQDALGHAALKLVEDLDAKAVVIHTRTGGTALFMSKSRPFVPIVAFTPDDEAVRRLSLYWGVTPVHAPGIENRDQLRERGVGYLRDRSLVKAGDKVVIISGTTFGQVGAADAIMVTTVP